MTPSRLLTFIALLALGLASFAAGLTSAWAQALTKCPHGYENLCAHLAQPQAQSNGTIGSEAGTGGNFTSHSRDNQLEDKGFYVTKPRNSLVNQDESQ